MKVLLVEDDEYLLSGLLMALKRREYLVETARTGTEALAALATTDFDIVILDLGLPGVDGMEVLSRIRVRGDETPVIVITARDGLEDRIAGLDLGASDYLIKPFDFRELEARMRAAMRKSQWGNKVVLEFGSLKLNTNNGSLTMNEDQLDLTPKETVVLKTLITRAGRVVSKRQLLDHVSDWEDESSENAIEITVHRLRRKLEATDVLISTVRGFGYMLEKQG
jgi:DNA-binding response OmpR family regulator